MKLLILFICIWLSFTIGRGYDTPAPAKVSLSIAASQAQYLIAKTTAIINEATNE